MRCGGLASSTGQCWRRCAAGEAVEAYRLAQWSIDMVGGDPVKGRTASFGSPLAVSLLYRGLAGCSLGRPDWRDDMRSGIAMQRSVDANGLTLLSVISIGLPLRHFDRGAARRRRRGAGNRRSGADCRRARRRCRPRNCPYCSRAGLEPPRHRC